ncbi:transcription factor [Fusarium heterosporum]|uniref:Transcription factor n=1 Tax=Fusarium heterosporum TaxID=42747 RepID=A0A8H5WZA6_FUSHE|nr:transcription factor [Fusarium heterosporum]
MAPGLVAGTPPDSLPSDSGKPTVYLLDTFHPQVLAYCQENFNAITPENPLHDRWRQEARYLLVRSSRLTAQDIKSCPNLLAIGKQGVGIDKIDAEACKERGIKILNTPGVNARAVAELVLTLATSCARQVGTIVAKQSSGISIPKEKCSGLILHRKTIGILGMGNIGKCVAGIFRGAFEADIIAYDPFMPAEAWTTEFPGFTRASSVDEVLVSSDVITVHMPLTPETRGLIGYPQMEKMKRTAIVINTARGGIINEDDLKRALSERLIWGAGLDCHEQEPPSYEKYQSLWETGHVLSTPHIGAATAETQMQTGMAAARYLQLNVTSAKTTSMPGLRPKKDKGAPSTIDELERKERTLSKRLQELEASGANDQTTAYTSSPDDRHTVRSVAASSPVARQGASLSLSWAHIQNPFLLRRSIWALHQRLFNQNNQATNHDYFRAFMICAIGAVLLYRNKLHRRHPEAYYNAALQYIGPEFGIYHPIGTSIWDVVRSCGRLCIELGLHSNPHVKNDLLETQLRRRVFWQFYLIDRYSSTTLDRPFFIDDKDIETRFPVEVSDEDLDAANHQVESLDSLNCSQQPNVQSEMTIFFLSVRLRQISSHIQTEFSQLRWKINNTGSKYFHAGHVAVVMNKLLKELSNWRNSTPTIQEPTCLYEMQEWYDHLLARERLSVLRRAIDLVPKVNGSPPKEILIVFLRSALVTIERYHNLCQRKDMITHTRSYFHMLFTAGLSVMYCTSVTKKIDQEDLRASYEGLLRCQDLLTNAATQLPDAKSYVSVFEALLRDASQRLWPSIRDMPTGFPSDASLILQTQPNELSNFGEGTFSGSLLPTEDLGTLPTNAGNMQDLSSNRQFFDQSLGANAMEHFTNTLQADNGISPGYQDASASNWALLNYDSLWNMESALGQYVYGDPTNPGTWESFEFLQTGG